jgi:membrane protein
MTTQNGVEAVTPTSIWELLKATASRWFAINAPRLGAALAFYTMLSIAPLLVVCIGIAGMVFGQKAAQDQIAYQIQNVVGYESSRIIQALLQHTGPPASGAAAAMVGLFMLFFGASGVFGELRDSLNEVWGVRASNSSGIMAMIRYRFFSFAMVLGIGFLLLVSLILSAVIAAAGKAFTAYLPTPEAVLHLITIVVTFLMVTVLFALLYKLVPDIRIEWQDVWIGAAVTAGLFSFGKFLIGLYLGKASVGSAYGAAGSLVVFMVWVYYSAQIFFLGAEFTRTFAERHGSRAQLRVAKEKLEQKKQEENKAGVTRFRHPRSA